MYNAAITSIELVEGGSIIRQGHHFSLALAPRNAEGEIVDLTGKEIDLVIYKKGSGILYENSASFDSANKVIRVQVTENIGYGELFMEFTATDPNDPNYREKFPSNNHEGKLTVNRGSDDLDYIGVKTITADQLRQEQQALQNQYQAEIDPKIQDILTRAESLQEEFHAAVGGVTEDSEVILARQGFNTLGDKITSISGALADAGALVGQKTLLPTWLQEDVYNVLKKHNDYLRDYGINVKQPPYNAVGDGTTDDTAKIQAAIDYIESIGGGIVYLPKGGFYIPGNVYVKNPNVTIAGVGTLYRGAVIVGHETQIKTLNFKINGVEIDGGNVSNGKNGIEIRNARVLNISCRFQNLDKAIYIQKVFTNTNQHTNKLTVEGCTFTNTSYNLYMDRHSDNGVWAVGDVKMINNNPCRAFITNVFGLNVDGFTSIGNEYFQSSYNDKSQIKKHNIYLDFCNWVSIGFGDKMFEAGEEAILISRFENLEIIGANIAWPGQKKISSGIRLDIGGRSANTIRRCDFTLTANIIKMPTKHGIEINDQVGGGAIVANTTRSAGDISFYYGDGVKTTAQLQAELDAAPHYGVTTGVNTSYNNIVANVSSSNTNLVQGIENFMQGNMEFGRVVPFTNRVRQHFSGSSIDIAGYEELQLRATAPVSLTDITGGFNGQLLFLVAYNNNTTIVHDNAKIRLSGKTNVNLQTDGTILLRRSSNVWYQV
ncbi:glycosyl hydrolase family 28-related protein [Jeotgalibacillus campisalis]|uniref:Rhamnogalacturonase A/B/Epimerase-like pectate lyase domain-containing protein n=1 Tax=Jeotgalibacillus campisalis TaxID=220754 RepID=A0A0C2VQ59_9BACL|nr:glycosyl hydrolase family 28-related protein [Jeotgalibacillus campisalis]KIL46148.1 hypothetical protein KR50_28230 [Jeotgalibacillus campisalis]